MQKGADDWFARQQRIGNAKAEILAAVDTIPVHRLAHLTPCIVEFISVLVHELHPRNEETT